MGWLTQCYRNMHDFKTALPHSERLVTLSKELTPHSLQVAMALTEVCSLQRGLRAFSPAREAITEAIALAEQLGLQHHEQYGAMLMELGSLHYDQGRILEALTIYNKAKVVLADYKKQLEYGVLIGALSCCYQDLYMWNEAVASLKELVEHCRNLHGISHPSYATTLYNLASLYDSLKQFEEAIPRYEEAHAIRLAMLGAKHQYTKDAAKSLAYSRKLLKAPRREIDVGHEFRMCSYCENVKESMSVCPCFRAWYCNTDCQLQHWVAHKPHCSVCFYCSTPLTKVLNCSRCKIAKYCNTDCQKAHWVEHNKDCPATK